MGDTTNLKRRNFLLNVGLGGAGAAAAAIGAKALVGETPQTGEQTKADRSRGGYRLSEHINNYYRTTRI